MIHVMCMPDSRDNADFEMFASLKHPVRREILRILSKGPTSYSDLLTEFKIQSSHLNYHLEGLRNLVCKTEDGRYALSDQGKTACLMMEGIHGNRFNPKANHIVRKRVFRLGKYPVPLWAIAVPMILMISSGVLGYYLYSHFTVPLNINEPIEIVSYPSQWSLYPGETMQFNVTVNNHASQNYTVIFDFTSNDMIYQAEYITFEKTNYTVVPGQQNLASWLNVGTDAPSANLNITITLLRVTDRYLENRVVNGDFETGSFAGWIVDGICNINSAVVHGGNYAVHISSETYDSSITQKFSPMELSVDNGLTLDGWIYPNTVGELNAVYPSSGLLLRFYDNMTRQSALNVTYAWCWIHIRCKRHVVHLVHFAKLERWTME